MKNLHLFLLSTITFLLFVAFSYTVAKEYWQQVDFDTMVKLQDRIPRRFDSLFSYFSILGSAEVTLAMVAMLAFLSLVRLKILSFIAWLIVIPASFFEVVGKLILFHPGPPVLFHRSIIETQLPSFYIHTNFSYPSGHMTRTTFIVTVFIALAFYKLKGLSRLISIAFLLFIFWMMFTTRVYLGEHWLSDVIGGVFLGLSSGLLASFLILVKFRR